MNEDDARRLLLVRAVESEDTPEALLTRDDRLQATGFALSETGVVQGGKAAARKADEAFLARRSQFAFMRLATRFPAVERARRRAAWPVALNWLPLGAFVLGVVTNEIDSGQRLNIIAFPLAGMVAWNLAVYFLLALAMMRRVAPWRTEAAKPGWLARLLARAAYPGRQYLDAQAPLGRALTRFGGDWLHYSSKLTTSRAKRTLHLAAAALAAGVISGMYARALGLEYRAGWESTFIGAGTLGQALQFVLGPASALSGIALPAPDHLEALRWTTTSRGENAAPWIHLYATTAFLFIIGPRLLLAVRQMLKARHLQSRFPIPGTEDFYVRRLLRSARGGETAVRVIPYSFHPPAETQARLLALLKEVLGERTRMTIDAPIIYGGEDEWLAHAVLDDDADHIIIMFGLSATPEAEVHGALVAGIQQRLAKQKSGAGLTVLLDESALRKRHAEQGGADKRLVSRRLAWENTLAPRGVIPLAIDLDDADAATLARRVEGALMKGPELLRGGVAA